MCIRFACHMCVSSQTILPDLLVNEMFQAFDKIVGPTLSFEERLPTADPLFFACLWKRSSRCNLSYIHLQRTTKMRGNDLMTYVHTSDRARSRSLRGTLRTS